MTLTLNTNQIDILIKEIMTCLNTPVKPLFFFFVDPEYFNATEIKILYEQVTYRIQVLGVQANKSLIAITIEATYWDAVDQYGNIPCNGIYSCTASNNHLQELFTMIEDQSGRPIPTSWWLFIDGN